MPSITDWNVHNLLKLVNQNLQEKPSGKLSGKQLSGNFQEERGILSFGRKVALLRKMRQPDCLPNAILGYPPHLSITPFSRTCQTFFIGHFFAARRKTTETEGSPICKERERMVVFVGSWSFIHVIMAAERKQEYA